MTDRFPAVNSLYSASGFGRAALVTDGAITHRRVSTLRGLPSLSALGRLSLVGTPAEALQASIPEIEDRTRYRWVGSIGRWCTVVGATQYGGLHRGSRGGRQYCPVRE